MFTGGDQTLNIILKLKDQASATLKTAQQNLDSFKGRVQQMQPAFQKMAVAGGAAFAALGLGMKRALGEAVDLGESVNAVNVVFKDASDQILAFGENAATAVGLSNAQFNQMSTITGALLKDTGLSMSEVSDMTIELTKRAADMASVFNTDVNDAMSAINQAIRGETEAIRRYAGDVTDASLQTYLYSQGINRSVLEMTQQEKKLLRVDLLMAQTADTANDFANTQDSLANQQRILGAQFRDMAATLGAEIIPVVSNFLKQIKPVIDNIAVWIGENPKLAATIVAVAAGLAGLVAVVGVLGMILPAIATGFSLIISPAGLIVVAIMAVIAAGILLVKNWDKIKAFAIRIWTSVKDFIVGVMISIGDFFIGIWESITQGVQNALNSIRDFFVNIFEGIANVTRAIWDGIVGTIKNTLALIVGIVAMFLDAILPGWDTALVGMWNTVTETFTKIAQTVKRTFTAIKDILFGFQGEVKYAQEYLGQTFGEIGARIGVFLENARNLFTQFADFWRGVWEAIKGAAQAVFDQIASAVSVFASTVNAAVAGVRDFWQRIWQQIASFFVGLWEPVKEAFKSVIDWILDKINQAIQKYNELKALLSKPIKAVGEAASSVGGFFNQAINRGRDLLGFAQGGIVPGPIGKPVPILAHGQEMVVPQRDVGAYQKGIGGTTININNPVVRNDNDLVQMERMVEQVFRQVFINNKMS